jgi:hypothetical protein
MKQDEDGENRRDRIRRLHPCAKNSNARGCPTAPMTGPLPSPARRPGVTTLDFDLPWRLQRRAGPTRDRPVGPSVASPRTKWRERDRQAPRRNHVRNNDRTVRSRPVAPPRHRPAGKARPCPHPEARTMVLLLKIESSSGHLAAPLRSHTVNSRIAHKCTSRPLPWQDAAGKILEVRGSAPRAINIPCMALSIKSRLSLKGLDL